eukprot:2187325-Amphidinium_carterae.1
MKLLAWSLRRNTKRGLQSFCQMLRRPGASWASQGGYPIQQLWQSLWVATFCGKAGRATRPAELAA